MFITPIREADVPNEIRVFRDDVYPFLGGGNKGRKMEYIGRAINAKKANALVTTGGIQSNHCRAAAVFAAENGLECTLVLHGSKELFLRQNGNAKVIRDTGATTVFVEDPGKVSSSMDGAMLGYMEDGYTPYYIYGGGHTMEGGLAYINAVRDLKKISAQSNWYPDFIFHASGTGSTQAGILAGLDKYGFDAEVVGISVGRSRSAAEQVVSKFYDELCRFYNISNTTRRVTVLDDYLCGGYGLFNSEIDRVSMESLRKYGFALDKTYTAKAFYGMLDYIEKHQLQGSNILFWHTGGVLNYLAE